MSLLCPFLLVQTFGARLALPTWQCSILPPRKNGQDEWARSRHQRRTASSKIYKKYMTYLLIFSHSRIFFQVSSFMLLWMETTTSMSPSSVFSALPLRVRAFLRAPDAQPTTIRINNECEFRPLCRRRPTNHKKNDRRTRYIYQARECANTILPHTSCTFGTAC